MPSRIYHQTILAITVVALTLTGCGDSENETISAGEAKNVVDALTYVKASNGLCFGVSAPQKKSSSLIRPNGLVIVQVNCDKIGMSDATNDKNAEKQSKKPQKIKP